MENSRGRRRKNGDVETVRSQVQSQASQAVIIQRRCSGALSDSKVSGNLPLQLPLLKQKAAVLHIWKNNSDSASSYLIPFGFYVFLLSWGEGSNSLSPGEAAPSSSFQQFIDVSLGSSKMKADQLRSPSGSCQRENPVALVQSLVKQPQKSRVRCLFSVTHLRTSVFPFSGEDNDSFSLQTEGQLPAHSAHVFAASGHSLLSNDEDRGVYRES